MSISKTKWLPFSRRHIQMHFLQWKCMNFDLKFHWRLLLRIQLTIFQHYWQGAGQARSHCLNLWWFVCWRIYASLGLNGLTHCDVMISEIWVKIGLLHNGLVPDGTKPLPDLSSIQGSVAFTWEQFHKKCSWILINNMCSKIKLSKLRPHFQGDNELKHSIDWCMTEARQHCSLSSLICPCLYKWSPDGMDPTQYIGYIYIYCCFSTEFPEHTASWWCIYTLVSRIIIGSWYGQLLI